MLHTAVAATTAIRSLCLNTVLAVVEPIWCVTIPTSMIGGSFMTANQVQATESSIPGKQVLGAMGACAGAAGGFFWGVAIPFGLPVAIPVVAWNYIKSKAK